MPSALPPWAAPDVSPSVAETQTHKRAQTIKLQLSLQICSGPKAWEMEVLPSAALTIKPSHPSALAGHPPSLLAQQMLPSLARKSLGANSVAQQLQGPEKFTQQVGLTQGWHVAAATLGPGSCPWDSSGGTGAPRPGRNG